MKSRYYKRKPKLNPDGTSESHVVRRRERKLGPRKPNPLVSATQKAMDLLAMRDHSVLELRKKLKLRGYQLEDIEKAMEYVQKNNWIKPPAELSEVYSRQLGRKNKSQLQINMNLASKGLPSIKLNEEEEYEKALRLVEKSFSIVDDLNREEKQKLKAKVARRLQTRGYSFDVISKVLKEVFNEKRK